MKTSLHRNYIRNCIINLWYLKEITNIFSHLLYFLPDLIYLIIGIYWSFRSEPMLLTLTTQNDIIFHGIKYKWEDILKKLYEVYPKLRSTLKILKGTGNTQLDNYMSSQKYLRKYREGTTIWIPFWLIIPGPLWDKVLIDEDTELVDGVQILDSKWENNKLITNKDSEISTLESFIEWISNRLNNSDFLRVQNDV